MWWFGLTVSVDHSRFITRSIERRLVIPPNAPKGCTLAVEWGKDQKDIPGGNLERKVNSFWNFAGEIGRNGKGGMVHGVSLGRWDRPTIPEIIPVLNRKKVRL